MDRNPISPRKQRADSFCEVAREARDGLEERLRRCRELLRIPIYPVDPVREKEAVFRSPAG